MTYDYYRFKREMEHLTSCERIDFNAERATEHMEKYIKDTNVYLKCLARHRKFVERNIEYETSIEIEMRHINKWSKEPRLKRYNRYNKWSGKGNAKEYNITINRVPLLHNELIPYAFGDVIYNFSIPIRQKKWAITYFLRDVMAYQPRFIIVDDVALYRESDTNIAKELTHYVHKLPEFKNAIIRGHLLTNVIDIIDISKEISKEKSTFDIDKMYNKG